MSGKNGRHPVAVLKARMPEALSPTGAVMAIVNLALQQDGIKIALSAYLEGRRLEGQWALRIVAAELVPVEDAPDAVGQPASR